MFTRWKELAEVVGLLAIVASLIFVGLKMRQTQEIARARFGSDTSGYVITIFESMTEPELAAAHLKMLEQPENLTYTEMLQVNALLTMVAELVFRECLLVDRDVFAECETFLDVHGRHFFGNKYAQSWWRHNRPLNYFGHSQEVDDTIAGFAPDSNLKALAIARSEMR